MNDTPIVPRQELLKTLNWITHAGVEAMRGCHFRARRKASREELGDGLLWIAAESYYVLYVNDKVVGSGPARGTKTCNFADRYDVSAFLGNAENFIAVEIFCNNFDTFLASPAEPALWVSIGNVETDANWQVQIASDCHSQDMPLYTFQIGLMEYRDWRKTPVGWMMFQDKQEWDFAQVIAYDRPLYTKKLFQRDVALLRETYVAPSAVPNVWAIEEPADPNNTNVAEQMTYEALGPLTEMIDVSGLCRGVAIIIAPPKAADGVALIVDFGQAFVGGVELEVDAPTGTIMDLGYDELIEEGRLRLLRNSYRLADRHILREGRQKVSNHLHIRGGRYLQIVLRSFNRPITLHGIHAIDRRYPVGQPAQFSCSDEQMNQLWQRCLATMSACCTDTFIDCPWREAAFWVNDFLVHTTFWFDLFGNQDVVRRCLSLAISQRNNEGMVPGVCPSPPKDELILFPTGLFLPHILRQYLRYTADQQFVDAIALDIADVIDCYQPFEDADELLNPPKRYWNFVDWSYTHIIPAEQYPLDSKNTAVVNWFYVLACDNLAAVYKNSDSVLSRHYDGKARRIADSIQKRFWNAENNIFYEFPAEGNQPAVPANKLTYALAVLSGKLSNKIAPACQEMLLREDIHLPELYMMHFVFEALAQMNRFDVIDQLIARYWLPMLQTDIPTIWEANVYESGKQAFHQAGSLCHAFSLAPGHYLQHHVLGVTPLADGFTRFAIRPACRNLDWAQGTVKTPSGKIKVQWRKDRRNLQLLVTVPGGTVAELPDGRELPTGDHRVVLTLTE